MADQVFKALSHEKERVPIFILLIMILLFCFFIFVLAAIVHGSIVALLCAPIVLVAIAALFVLRGIYSDRRYIITEKEIKMSPPKHAAVRPIWVDPNQALVSR